MIRLPLSWVRFLVDVSLIRRPDFLAVDVDETPDNMTPGFVYREVRGGYEKWVHLKCPRCSEHIQMQLAGAQHWSVSVDWMNRPTIRPSIWQTGSCQAHFFVRKGAIDWCPDITSPRSVIPGRYA